MKLAASLLVALLCFSANAQYVSYWFQSWMRQGDARDAAAYFMRPGTNIYFTYASNRVYINASGTITNVAGATNAVYALYATNWLNSTNFLLSLTNFPYTVITNAPWQWGCPNLSNWCLLDTNIFTNYTYTTNLSLGVTISNVDFNSLGTTNYAGFQAHGGTFGGFTNRLAVGFRAEAEGTNSGGGTAIGSQAIAYDGGTALGYAANAQSGGTAIGYQASAVNFAGTLPYGIAIGQGANGDNRGIGIGAGTVTAPEGIAIGMSASAPQGGISIGQSSSSQSGGIAIGSGGTQAGSLGVAIGGQVQGTNYGVAIGYKAFANDIGNVAIGGSDTGVHAMVPAGFGDTVELGRGTATCNGGLNFRGHCLMNSSFQFVGDAILLTNYQATNVANWAAGTNILFSTNAGVLYINTSSTSPMPPAAAFWLGDGTNIFWTNAPPAEVYIGDGITRNIELLTDGSATFSSNLNCKTTISTKDFTASGNIVGGPSAVLYGNGSGLTNLSLGSLPSGVLTNNWNGGTIVVTGAVYFAQTNQNLGLMVSNGVNFVNITNGALRTSGGATIGNGLTVSAGNVSVSASAGNVSATSFNAGQSANTVLTGIGGEMYLRSALVNSNLYIATTGTGVVKMTNQTGGLVVANTIAATNGFLMQVKPQFATNFTAVVSQQTYICNGTNQVVTLPTGSAINDIVYRFSCTNGWGKFILSNSIAGGTIRDGFSPTFTQIGIGSPSFFTHDGGTNWVSAARTKVVMPNAQFSCTTNIPLTLANTAYPVTFNSVDFDNSQGIALLAGTNGLNSKIVITNLGQYEFDPSVVISFGGNNTVRYWFRSNDTNVPNSCTPVRGQNNTIRVVTVPFVVNVTQRTEYEIWAESDNNTESLLFQAASGNYPLAPSVIVPVKKISDTWP